MRLLLGIDGGGTKTEAVLCNETGRVLGHARGPATNPISVSEDAVRKRLAALLREVLQCEKGLRTPIEAYYAGIGGGGLPTTQSLIAACLAEILPHANRRSNGSDATNTLNSGIGMSDGIMVIAGTGSSVYLRTNRKLHLITGWGYLLGDEGSGYDLGRMALVSALRAEDGRGQATLLQTLVSEKLGSPVRENIPQIYQGGRTFIASFAPIMLEAAAKEDPIALCCVEQAAQALAEPVRVAGARHTGPDKRVVIAGGIFQPGGMIERLLREILEPDYTLVQPNMPPVYGAVLEAANAAEIHAGEAFERTFQHTWEGK